MTPTSAPPALEPVWLRLLRGAVALALALALTTVVALVIFGYVPAARNVFEPLFVSDSQVPRSSLALAILFFIFLPVLMLFWPFLRRVLRPARAAEPGAAGRNRRSRNRWLNWTALACGWAVVLPVLVWLAWDDPVVRQPMSIEEFAPAFPGAGQSYAVLMQYSQETPSKQAADLATARLAVTDFPVGPQDGAKWVAFVAANRAGLETDWNTLLPQRRWLDELAAFDRIGDLTPAGLMANEVTLHSWRTLAYHVCGLATSQALDSHGDNAVATLLPLLEVSRKLPVSSRTLLRSIMAEMTERLALQTAALVIDRTSISQATRDRLGVLLGNETAPIEARRLITVDSVQVAPISFSLKLGDAVAPADGLGSFLRIPLNFISVFVINPRATMNLYGDHIHELAALAEARKLDEFALCTRDFTEHTLLKPGIKNLGGRLLVHLSVPAYNRVLDIHWKNADLRDSLRQRLSHPG